MPNYDVSVAIKNSCSGCGEGPHWDELNQCLWHVNFEPNEGQVIRYTPSTNESSSQKFSKSLTFVIPYENNKVGQTNLVTGQIHDVTRFRWEHPEDASIIAQVETDLPTRLNDAKCDARGRLWMGTLALAMDLESINPHGISSMFSVDNDGSVHHIHNDVNLGNGFTWSLDNRTMFFVDSCARAVYAYDFDLEAGIATNRRVAIDYAKYLPEKNYGLPDGQTVDLNGKLWVASYGASSIVCWDPETGKPIDEIKFPCTNITSCTFGGQDYKEMYVTSSTVGLTPDELKHTQPLAGSLFKVTGFSFGGQKTPGFVHN